MLSFGATQLGVGTMIEIVSTLSGQICIAWLIGFGVGKAHSLLRVLIKRSSGTY